MARRFEIHEDRSGQSRVRSKYSGEVIFSTEAFTTKASARKAIRSIKENGPAVPVEELTLTGAAKTPARTAAAKAAAHPVAALKAAAKAVGAAVAPAVKTPRTSKG